MQDDASTMKLTDVEKAALNAFPDCAIGHWLLGERLNFDKDEWFSDGILGTKNPDHYEFQKASGFGGITKEEIFKCLRCGKTVRRTEA